MNQVTEILVPYKVDKLVALGLVNVMRSASKPSCRLYRTPQSSHVASFCAQLKTNPSTLLAPVLVFGLHQAASSENPLCRFWMDNYNNLHELHSSEIEPITSVVGTLLDPLDVLLPATPIITDYLFMAPFADLLRRWGGISETNPVICRPGVNGQHTIVRSSAGVLLLSPNCYDLSQWQTQHEGRLVRHVIQYDFGSGATIYWSQKASDKFSCINSATEPTERMRGNSDLSAATARSRNRILRRLVERSSGFSSMIGVIYSVNVIKQALLLNGNKLDAFVYSEYQNLLFALLDTLQHYRVTQAGSSSLDELLAYELLPNAIARTVDLIQDKSLNLPKLVARAESIIEDILSHHATQKTQISGSMRPHLMMRDDATIPCDRVKVLHG